MKRTAPTVEQSLYRLGIAAAIFAAAILVLAECVPVFARFLNWSCPFRAITGLYCPGCGGTRALSALLHGRVLESLKLHPFVLYGLGFYLIFMGSWTLNRLTRGRIPGLKYRSWYVWGGVILVAGNWLIKNILLLSGRAML